MEFLADVADWFLTADNWSGGDGILSRTFEHIRLSAFSVALAALVAIPPALWLGHTGRGGFLAVSIVNIGRAVPSFAIVALALPFTIELAQAGILSSGLGFAPTFLALFALAIPPIFTNTYTGVREVDRGMIEAGRGMGLTERQILTQIELPVAAPLMLAATRVAAVQVVATATLGALVAWGGLGRYIIDGFAQQDNVEVMAGAILVAGLSIATELAFIAVERLTVPEGIRRSAADQVAGAKAV